MQNKKLPFAVIVLAAGEGRRMESKLSKVLHRIAGKPMIVRTIETLKRVNPYEIIIVANPQNLVAIKKEIPQDVKYTIQKSPLGTADAASCGLKLVDKNMLTVAVMYGDDSTFYRPETILEVFKHHQDSDATLTFVTVKKDDPTDFGRIVRKDGKVVSIVEEKDTSAVQKKINEVNASLYFFDKRWLLQNLTKIKPSPVTSELYITDLIAIATGDNQKVETFPLGDENEWQSVNTKEELLAVNLNFQKRIHIMGIAGAGAAAIAGIAKATGFEVTGCDLNPKSPYTQNLKIKIRSGHNPSHIEDIGMLVISPAVLKFNPKNQELKYAKEVQIPILTWQEFQGKYLQKDKFVICVAGAYGKSTTTTMIAKTLTDLGKDPTCEIGATVLEWQQNFRVGKSNYYVCEADEYNDNFLNYQPDIAVVLNLDWDHPDYFKTKKQLFGSYKKFVSKIKKNGTLIIPNTWNFTQLTKFIRKDIKVIKIGDFGKLDLSIIGDFRSENANAALTVAKVLGLNITKAKKSIENFKGIARRLEYKGEVNDVKVYDDYAVQPYTVLKTANALEEKFKDKKVVLVFEPHTFSRIKTFFNDFVKNLKKSRVDKILVTEVYAAREKGDRSKLAQKLAQSVGPKATFTGSLKETAMYLKNHLADFDIILLMGAGDVYKLYEMLL